MIDRSARVEFDDVEFDNVEVVRHATLIVMCRVGQKVVAVPLRRMRPGTTIAQMGDRGRLVLRQGVALNLGLV